MFDFMNFVDKVTWTLQRVCKHMFYKGVLTGEPLLWKKIKCWNITLMDWFPSREEEG